MTTTTGSTDTQGLLARAAGVVGQVLVPLGAVTGVLYYFGYVRERALYAYFGVPVGSLDLTDVVAGELLEGTMRITGRLPAGYEPFETRIRIEFHDEPDGRTRLEVRQWLAENLVSPTQSGWAEAFSKLDTVLAG